MPAYQPFSYDCIEARDLVLIDGLVTSILGVQPANTFRRRNNRSKRIAGQIVGTVVVPADQLLALLNERGWPRRLPEVFRGISGAVIFSAPLHPVANRAAVYVLRVIREASLVLLERDQEGWRVSDVKGLWVS